MKNKILIIVVVLASNLVFGQDFYKSSKELKYEEGDKKISKVQYFLSLNDNTPSETLLKNCESYIANLRTNDANLFIESHYIFYKNNTGLSQAMIESIDVEDLIESHKNDILIIVSYKESSSGYNRESLIMNNGSSIKFFQNGVEKQRLR